MVAVLKGFLKSRDFEHTGVNSKRLNNIFTIIVENEISVLIFYYLFWKKILFGDFCLFQNIA